MKDNLPCENQPPIMSSIADSMSYQSTPNHGYLPSATYYPPSHNSGPVQVAPQPRQEPQQRKRPKYTRSKTGCLTCRVKKIKCDETKPICMRCTHGQRDCTWPEGVPTRKKAAPRKEGADGRPSTAESSGISETSTPPTRDSTPPRRPQGEPFSLPPVVARRHSESFAPPLGPDPEVARRQLAPHPYQLHHPSQNNVLSMIPEMPAYQSTRYDHTYGGAASMHSTPSRLPGPSHQSSHPLQMRSMTQHHQSQQHHQQHQAQHWTQAQMLPPLNPMESFFHPPQERNLVGHSSSDHHPRYQ